MTPEIGEPQPRLQPDALEMMMTWGETPGHNGCAARDLNPEPADKESAALPIELAARASNVQMLARIG